MKMNGIAIIAFANKRIESFCLKVIPFCFTKLSKCFLYKEVPLNHFSKRSEPFTKQKDANNKNGVVGKTGNIMPRIPKPMDKKPTIIYMIFMILLITNPRPLYLL